MLAYELYLHNKDTDSETGKGVPIKKIFIDKDSFKIDDTPIDKYGETNTSDPIKNWFQRNFDMPIDTIKEINLPNKLVASNASKPYVTIYGLADFHIKTKKGNKEIIGKITLGDKKKKPYAELLFPEKNIELISSDTELRINSSEYLTKDNITLYEQYQKNQIIREGKLSAELFKKIATEFFNYVLDKNIELIKGKTSFQLYILPNEKEIKYISKEQKEYEPEIIDAFGKTGTWHNKPSNGVTFFSYDDPAFTINCKQKEEFYKDVGINNASLQKILLPEKNKINISGFEWYFFDLKNPEKIFTKKSRGIYDQIHTSYTELKQDSIDQKSSCKVMCIKKTNAKREVMIDENLTMHRMNQIFKIIESNDLVPWAFEKLIVKRGRSSTYRYYIQAIKSLLNQTPFDREQLDKICLEQIKINLGEWLKNKADDEPANWFRQFEFCKKTLKYSKETAKLLDYERFAENVGKMAREYIKFRKAVGGDNNSLRDILIKSKYDIETLKFVIKTISRGIHLVNVPNNKQKELENIDQKMISLMPSPDIEIDQNKDMSYYFYLGYFRKEGSN